MITSKNYFIQFFVVITLITTGMSFDYNQDHSLECSQISSAVNKLQQNLDKLWNILIIHIIDKIYFLVVCPIILLAQIVVIITYAKYTQLRAKPGNIFCGLVIIQMGLNLHVFANAIYRTIYDSKNPMPPSFVSFCISMGFMSSFFSLLHFMYLIMFMFYTIFLFRFSLKKKSNTFWMLLHAFVIAISVLLTIFFYLEDFMGLNFYGICGLTQTRKLNWNAVLPIIEIIVSVIFAFLGIFTFVYFRKHMPGGQGFKRRKLEESKIIFMYVAGFSTFQVLTSVMGLLLVLNCTQPKPIPELNIFITVTNIIRQFQFIFLIFLIMFNQKFRKKIKHILKSLFQFRSHHRTSSLSMIENLELEDVIFNQKLLDMKEKSNEIDLLLLSQIYTIISGVYVTYYQYFRDISNKQLLKSINYRQSITFSIDNKSMMIYQTQARYMIKLKILPCSIVIHSPKVFTSLLSMDNLNNVFQSFKIVDNSIKLSNLAEGSGGRSGQFFFFSSDNKYVIKTITFQQFQFYQQNLQAFMDHYERNPDSLLAKILGLFTIRGDQMQRTYYLIIMKNILGCKKHQILRLYDLKGSKYDRQVLFEEIQINQVSKMTLKDIDFINYQQTLKISQQKGAKLRDMLRNDTKFLKGLNLLDYSLLIVRVKWSISPEQQSFWGNLQRIQHINSKNQFYHIGVIDYMQKWDFQKKSEKWWKNLLGKKDVSAEQPNRYQARFMEFVDQITQCGLKLGKPFIRQQTGIQMREVRSITEPNRQLNMAEEKSQQLKERNTNNI